MRPGLPNARQIQHGLSCALSHLSNSLRRCPLALRGLLFRSAMPLQTERAPTEVRAHRNTNSFLLVSCALAHIVSLSQDSDEKQRKRTKPSLN